jgi:hypothetical protein
VSRRDSRCCLVFAGAVLLCCLMVSCCGVWPFGWVAGCFSLEWGLGFVSLLQSELVESSLSWWVLGSVGIREFATAVAVSSSKSRSAVAAAVAAALRLRA